MGWSRSWSRYAAVPQLKNAKGCEDLRGNRRMILKRGSPARPAHGRQAQLRSHCHEAGAVSVAAQGQNAAAQFCAGAVQAIARRLVCRALTDKKLRVAPASRPAVVWVSRPTRRQTNRPVSSPCGSATPVDDYSETRVAISRNRSLQVDATNRAGVPKDRSLSLGWSERRPCTKLLRTQ
jgi:hypothetical protein